MKYFNHIGVIASVAVILSCFMIWVTIPDLGIKVGGFFSEGTRFGKPGLMNAIMSAIAMVMFLVPKIWAKRANLFFAGFNIAWAIRNYILITACHGGDCPVKELGIYVFLAASALQMVMAAFPHLPLEEKK
ncbi:hypothetical protein [Flavihumibacter profundi]|uniref:hypothetical protein n=1 Tax=Flavihumibacter profundi TaxID=2716883 RepID=UPI001CC3A903|nr:hypothetical protein [Flavihumibacter profundi]MBZ5856448.1 hypothetical protein [Flavihumibacter profundi]